jgi:hypothetical protein
MKILHLTLKKKWFDMIASGEKKEEYREWKVYWINRLIVSSLSGAMNVYGGDYSYFKSFNIIRFKNGYAKDAAEMDVEWKGAKLTSEGNSEWGFTGKCIAIQLGKVLETRNYNPSLLNTENK